MGSQEPCIYRVPSQLRDVKPEAYKPRMLLIGPLHHSAKPKAHKGNADSRYLEYGMMEDHKRMYRAEFTKRPDAIAIIEQMTKTIKREEYNIRASYAVSTAWILPYIFVELILNDSIFIAEFILRLYENRGKIGDLIVDNDFYTSTVLDDLKLLENQIPYFCLKELLNPILEKYFGPESQNLDQVFLRLFSVDMVITEPITFNHFTDMFRCVYVKSLGDNLHLNNLNDPILVMKNADKLSSVGVEFKGVELPYSLNVTYEEGCLTIPSFQADEASNVIVRNIIAYEQCHDPERAFTTNYICFMNYLITSDKDVEILATSEVLTNGVGGSRMVLKTMNNLCTGVQISPQTQYQDVIKNLNTHYKSRRNRRLTRLRKVYFSDTWTTTATVAAIFLLLVTLLGTVAAVFQAMGVKMRV